MPVQQALAAQHLDKLRRSGLSNEAIMSRGYESTAIKSHLESLGFARWQCHVPAMVIPLYDVNGQRSGTQIRPDKPRIDPKKGRVVKYESPKHSEPIIDVPPLVRAHVLDPQSPLFITEGALKADAAASRGLACVSVSGVWAWKSNDPFWKKTPINGRRVYIVFDSDLSSNVGVKKACIKLLDELKSKGADPQVIYLPDVNGSKQGLDDFLAANNTLDDLLQLASSKAPELDQKEEALGNCSSYQTSPEGLIRVLVKGDKAIVEPLTNFNAHISTEIEIRDGSDIRYELLITAELASVESIVWVPSEEFDLMNWVVPKLGGGAIIYAGFATRDHARAAIQSVSGVIQKKVLYEHLGWVRHNNRWLFLHAGGVIGTDPQSSTPANPDQLAPSKSHRDQELPSTSPIRPIVGMVTGCQGLMVRVPTVLQHYRLPEAPDGDQLVEAIQETISLLFDVAPRHITLPLLAGVFRIAIDRVDYSFHLVGRTNVGKTELVALFTQFFGSELHPRNLPGSWISTSNQVLATAWLAKNVLFPIDDFVPAGSQSDIERANREADRIFRSQGNQAGRGRCNRDGTPREGKPPRCMFVSTGEDVPEGHSLNSRVLTLEIRPGDVLSENTALLSRTEQQLAENKNKLLVFAQSAARCGLFAQVMGAYLRWLAPQYDEVRNSIIEQKAAFREVFQAPGRYSRTIDIAADLLAGYEVFLDFCLDSRAIDQRGFDSYWMAINEALHSVLDQQQQEAYEREPVNQFLSLLATAFTTGWAHLKSRCSLSNGVPEDDPEIWGWEERERTVTTNDEEGNPTTNQQSYFVPRGVQIGWVSGSDVYIESEAALAVIQRLARESNLRPLALTQRSLGKSLQAKGLLRTTSKDHYTSKVTVLGIQKRVLHLESVAIVEYISHDEFPDQEELMALLEP
jgi:hypothetical protein